MTFGIIYLLNKFVPFKSTEEEEMAKSHFMSHQKQAIVH
jgi:hypothetical protein